MNRNPSPLRTSLALLLPCLLLIASPGFAEDDEAGESFGRRGWYLAVNAVGAFGSRMNRSSLPRDAVRIYFLSAGGRKAARFSSSAMIIFSQDVSSPRSLRDRSII